MAHHRRTMTPKTAAFLAFIERNPGCIAAEVHRSLGHYYAHGHHKFSYETVGRMLKNGLIITGPSQCGRGAGLYPVPTGMTVAKAQEYLANLVALNKSA